jgi:predicted nucleic acid-binding protein
VNAVVDASLIVRLLANRRQDDLLRQRLSGPRAVHAPQLVDAEVASGIRGLLLGGRVNRTRAGEMVEDFLGLRIVRHPMPPLLPRVIELRDNFTAYDALYVALAEALRLPVLTADAKFARTAGHRADIQVYPTG